MKCEWNTCKFNENGMCYQDVHIVSINHHDYKTIYNSNFDEIKKHCRCLEPDLEQ